MSDCTSLPRNQTLPRLPAFGLCLVHATALLALYFVPAFICPTVVEHYKQIGFAETPLFARAHLISDFLCGYTWFFVGFASVYLYVIYRHKRVASRWLPAVSNIALLAFVLLGTAYTAWLINPMVFGGPVASHADPLDMPGPVIAKSDG
ncbi:hypothetical protein LF1_56420 [Rubripirellula obstinata]|uniref:Uncharacterized protein n=1 Tax=Rubripirellula obstinata TaxID=406547 RepID=A0A5B1CBY0_9BACT|nr:hypothetical protein [Rubripirellula obstinata]KAA1257080.1 hypothetical protein LF1_56420 [Rubripirellula obstinata]